MELQKTALDLVLYLFAASILGTFGLEFRLDNSYVCGQLVCEADADTSNHTILSIIEMSIYDSTEISRKLKLVSIRALEQAIHVDDVITNSINVEGTISDYHAHLQIGFRNQSYCTSGSFMCELTYVSPTGHVDVMQSPEIHADTGSGNTSTSSADNSGATSDVMNAINQLINRTDNLESSLVTVETKVDIAVQELRNLATLLTDVQTDVCYKGMASFSTSKRTLITVTGFGEALCDTTTDGGGWVVFQRRAVGDESFNREWAAYKSGFGNVLAGGDYWLGLDAIHALTSQRSTELRVDMDTGNGRNYYAVYPTFYVDDETSNFTLTIEGFSGNVTDHLRMNNKMPFSTYDAENDRNTNYNCAEFYHGGWWYNACSYVRLNALYGVDKDNGIFWPDIELPITFTEMKLRFTD